ncbi:hypothetical protein Tco_1065152 [Tanacetum coccineum]
MLADASLHVLLDEIKVDKTLRFVEEPVENRDREVKRFLTSPADDGRGSGSWMFLFVWNGYVAMRTLCGQAKLLAVRYLVRVGYVRFGNQSIERDRLIGIRFVLDFMELISFTFGDKEMISCMNSYLKEEWRGRVPETSEDICSKFDNLRFISLEFTLFERDTGNRNTSDARRGLGITWLSLNMNVETGILFVLVFLEAAKHQIVVLERDRLKALVDCEHHEDVKTKKSG